VEVRVFSTAPSFLVYRLFSYIYGNPGKPRPPCGPPCAASCGEESRRPPASADHDIDIKRLSRSAFASKAAFKFANFGWLTTFSFQAQNLEKWTWRSPDRVIASKAAQLNCAREISLVRLALDKPNLLLQLTRNINNL
jgi:hypothetical protein